MQIVGENANQNRESGNIQRIHPPGIAVALGLSHVIDDEHTIQRNQYHGYIVAVPDIPSQPEGAVRNKFVLDDLGRQPEDHEQANGYKTEADLGIHDPPVE